jgi:hypothetical protein
MAIRQRSGFVEKEQFGVRSGGHYLAMTPTKLQPTRDPASYLPVAYDGTLRVVQDAAIAH